MTKQDVISEIDRILSIPAVEGGAPDLTEHFRRPQGNLRLFPVQSQALWEAYHVAGMLAPIGAGEGKTLITCLIPSLFRDTIKRWVLLMPPSLMDQYFFERARFERHFYLMPNVTVVPYSKLSVASGKDILEELRPQGIMADEAHHLRYPTSARTKRFLRYFDNHPETRGFFLSGTLTSKSIEDYEHLAHLALKDNSPLPHDYLNLRAWAAVLDSEGKPTPEDWALFAKFFRRVAGAAVLDQNSAREVFKRRLLTTPGVIGTTESTVAASLLMVNRPLRAPDDLLRFIASVRSTWRIGEFEIQDAMTLARKMRELTVGYFYRLLWPNGVVNYPWLEARNAWYSEVRKYLNPSHSLDDEREDSLMLVGLACAQGKIPVSAPVFKAWAEWQQYKDIEPPLNETVWISDYMIQDVLRWVAANPRGGIVWYSSQALEAALTACGIPTFGRGTQPPEEPITCAMNIRVHGEGKNLHMWNTSLVVEPPATGKVWEQLLARSHRVKQEADEVYYYYYSHTDAYERAMTNSIRDARYIEQTKGTRQRLLYASYVKEQ